MLITATLSQGNQITVPSAIRKALGLTPGDGLVFDTERRTYAKAETQEEAVKRIFRELDQLQAERRKHRTPEQKAFDEMTRGWTANQYREYIDKLPETITHRKEKYGL